MSSPIHITATQAQAQIRAGTLTTTQYATTLLSHIAARDPSIHAWAYLNREQVLQRAKELDEVPVDERGPLHGVPIGVKDVFLTSDMPTEFNSRIYEGCRPGLDAAVVRLLRGAGALIFGKTTTTEFAASTVGPSYAGPKTSNPHDVTRTPGGSSAGSGAAVADFQVPIALGTQTIGSVVRPASFNGVYGFKPTWNLISREGARLYSLILDTVGFFTRSVEDFELLCDALNIHDDSVPDPPPPFQLAHSKFALLSFPTPEWPAPSPSTISALDKTKALLRAHGATIEEIDLPPAFKDLYNNHKLVLAADARVAFAPEHATAKEHLDPALISLVENAGGHSKSSQTRAFDAIAAMRPQMDALAAEYTAIIAPSAVGEAPVGHGNTGDPAFCAPWTALHCPVVNVPVWGLGDGEGGLPVGVSFVAGRNRDRWLLGVCRAVEGVLGAQVKRV